MASNRVTVDGLTFIHRRTENDWLHIAIVDHRLRMIRRTWLGRIERICGFNRWEFGKRNGGFKVRGCTFSELRAAIETFKLEFQPEPVTGRAPAAADRYETSHTAGRRPRAVS